MYHPRLRGSYHEMGHTYGGLLYKHGFKFPKVSNEMMDFGTESLKELARFYPEVIDEIRGFAEACKTPYEKVASFLLSIGVFKINIPKCSTFAAARGWHVIFGRNYDMLFALQKFTESCLVCPDNVYSYIGHSDVFIGKDDGINEKGLGVAITGVPGKSVKPGINFLFPARHVLEKCGAVDEAVGVLQNIQYSICHNYLLVDRSGSMAVVEVSPEKTRVRKPEKGVDFIVCTNHFLHPDMVELEEVEERAGSKTGVRYATIYSKLAQKNDVDTKEAKNILSDPEGHVCLNLKEHNWGTLYSFVADLSTLRAFRAEGRPDKTPYREDRRLIDEIDKRNRNKGKKMILGKLVTLRPATERDKRLIYGWLAKSDITPSIMGPPLFPDHLIPTWEEFLADYRPYYFDGSRPELGRCFIIMVNNTPVGQINYNDIDSKRRRTELDIWVSSEANCGKGYGPDALQALCEYLYNAYGIIEFVMRPSARNRRAIRAYEKAGFQREELSTAQQEAEYGHGDYDDTVVMVKHMPAHGDHI